jgi:hypothetical protein
MKNLALLLVGAALISSCATRTGFHTFYKDHKHEAALTVSTPSFVANLLMPKDDVKEYQDLFKKVRHYKIMIFPDHSKSMEQAFDRFIRKNRYDAIFKINDKGGKVSFYFLKDGDRIQELVMKVADNDSQVLLGLKTRLQEEEFNRILSETDQDAQVY